MKQPQAFDQYAADYDEHFTHAAIGQSQRRQVRKFFQRDFPNSCDILEINCGTGEDAIYLAKQGHRVLATDISSDMIRMGTEKLKQEDGYLKLTFLQAGFMALAEKLKGQQFDLIFSNFGGLNCLSPEKSRKLGQIFSDLLKPDGHLFLVYMSKHCLWERAYYFMKRRVDQAHRRLKSPSLVNLHGQKIEVWYYNKKEISSFFAANFQFIQAYPVGFFVPPSYLEHYFAERKKRLAVLEKLDSVFSLPWLADYADHFVVEFRRKD
ncbi:MAG: hypothetical protein DHS20C18_16010 [Saprospiraceae bacterium]|nr:MAG: hypothetical protein DHS20C18_16010 [Saprospiraceae bacterium]